MNLSMHKYKLVKIAFLCEMLADEVDEDPIDVVKGVLCPEENSGYDDVDFIEEYYKDPRLGTE